MEQKVTISLATQRSPLRYFRKIGPKKMEDRESGENIHGSIAKLSLLEDVDMSATCTLLNHLFVISDFGMYAFPVVA